jgi:hypothetical protein
MSGNAHQRRIARRKLVDEVHQMPDGSGFFAHMGVRRMPKGHAKRVMQAHFVSVPSHRQTKEKEG